VVTGVYLLFVYEVARPYASVRAIQGDPWLGRWIRALHRYASDATVLFVAIHAVRMFVERKTWGPRTLAWLTGLGLAAMLLFSGVTGYVLVWDQFGQKLAVTGARVLRLLPLFPEPPDRSFVGDSPLPAAFFFMNLFLHVAVPLGMIAFLWLHTSRLARAAWFPERRVTIGLLLALAAVSVAWPAPMPPAADLLVLPGRGPADWFYAFWLPLVDRWPASGLLTIGAIGLVLVAVPGLTRPRPERRPPPAAVDPDACEGCRQCFTDCPYDAIEMISRSGPSEFPLQASVVADACVACGLCAGSCASLAIGPPGHTARDQLAAARALVYAHTHADAEAVAVVCRANGDLVERADASRELAACLPVACAGALHPATASYLASRFRRTIIVTCAPHACRFREGVALADARLLEDRAPAIPGRLARQALRVLHGSPAEWPALAASIAAFAGGGVRQAASPMTTLPRMARRAATVVAGATALALAIVLGSAAPQGADASRAVLRLGWRLPGQAATNCRIRSAEELARLPVHMRTPLDCTNEALTYALRVEIDGQSVLERVVRAPGLRHDRPLSVEEDFVVRPGEHAVRVSFVPRGEGGRRLVFEGHVAFEGGRIRLMTHRDNALVVR